jgi:hypothetical protein
MGMGEANASLPSYSKFANGLLRKKLKNKTESLSQQRRYFFV